MRKHLTRAWFARAVIMALTVVLTWGVLLFGQQRTDITLTVGDEAPLMFVADRLTVVTDEAQTELDRGQAESDVAPIYTSDPHKDPRGVGSDRRRHRYRQGGRLPGGGSDHAHHRRHHP